MKSFEKQMKERLFLLDNVRSGLIFLCVLGHLIALFMKDSGLAYSIYIWIYSFHMPAFILIAGWVSKTEVQISDFKKYVNSLLIPYFIFEILFTCLNLIVKGKANWDLLYPQKGLWFLLALFFLKIILPVIAQMKYPLAISIVVSVAVGYFDHVGHAVTIARTLGLLPFFVLGWMLGNSDILHWWDNLGKKKKYYRSAAYLILFLAFSLVFIFRDQIRGLKLQKLLYYSQNAADLNAQNWWIFARPAELLIAALLTFCIILIFSSKQSWITKFGKNSINIYLSHLFVIYFLSIFNIFEGISTIESLTLAAGLSGVLVLVLGSNIFDRVFHYISKPNVSGIWKQTFENTRKP